MSKLRASNSAGKIPTNKHIGTHDIGINSVDEELFVNNAGTVKPLLGPIKTSVTTEVTDRTAEVTRLELIEAAMSKVDYFALAEQRKRESSGSGQSETGKHTSTELSQINQGLWSFIHADRASILHYGRASGVDDYTSGLSRTDYPILLVDGVQHRIEQVATSQTTDFNFIKFPPAEAGLRTYDTATGVVTTYTTSNEAFEGLVTNGDFRNGDTGDWGETTRTTLDISSGRLTATGSSTIMDYGFNFGQDNILDGSLDTVRIEIVISDISLTSGNVLFSLSEGINSGVDTESVILVKGLNVFTLTPSTNLKDAITFRHVNTTGLTDGDYIVVESVSVMPVTESVITSRKDLVFLETWHEAISSDAGTDGNKDEVYYLGNVQSGLSSPYSITSTTRSDGYTRFGEWDSTTTGQRVVWSTMTDAQKVLFLADPENNIYYDNEVGEYIQVRYRIRVIEGLGDDWYAVRPTNRVTATGNPSWLSYDIPLASSIVMRGDKTTFNDYHQSGQDSILYGGTARSQFDQGDKGVWQPTNTPNIVPCHGLPICLVQRLNQGAYHPVYNTQGCANTVQLSGSNTTTSHARQWYDSDVTPLTSTGEAFGEYRMTTTNSRGSTGGSVIARSGQYDFYDAIYSGLVEDLRLNSSKQDLNRLLEGSKRADVAGTTRGKSKVPYITKFMGSSSSPTLGSIYYTPAGSTAFRIYKATHSSPNYASNIIGDAVKIGSTVVLVLSTGSYFHGVVTYFDNNEIRVARGDVVFESTNFGSELTTRGTNLYDAPNALVFGTELLSAEYDSIPHVSIVGNPSDIQSQFPDGVSGDWISDDWTSGSVWNLTRKANSLSYNLFSTNGSSWTHNASSSLDSVNNTVIGSNAATGRVWMFFYESLSDFTEPSTNPEVLQLGDVYCGTYYEPRWGNRIMPSLIGKVSTNSSTALTSSTVKINQSTIDYDGYLSAFNENIPHHESLPLGNPLNGSPAVKSLMGLTSKDGLIYPCYWFSELSHDGTDWGDDSTITIVDSMSTKTDDNSVTVITGCHIGKLPIGIK